MSDYKAIKRDLQPYVGVIRFMVVLFAANILWKLLFSSDATDTHVELLHRDVSAFFQIIALHLVSITNKFFQFFGYHFMPEGTNLIFGNGRSVQIIWGCTGVKQSFIFFFIMLFSRGPWLHKLWFIPGGIILIYFLNVARIIILSGVMAFHETQFNLFHNYITKYLFYIIIFGIWMLWEEVVVSKWLKKKNGLQGEIQSEEQTSKI